MLELSLVMWLSMQNNITFLPNSNSCHSASQHVWAPRTQESQFLSGFFLYLLCQCFNIEFPVLCFPLVFFFFVVLLIQTTELPASFVCHHYCSLRHLSVLSALCCSLCSLTVLLLWSCLLYTSRCV